MPRYITFEVKEKLIERDTVIDSISRLPWPPSSCEMKASLCNFLSKCSNENIFIKTELFFNTITIKGKNWYASISDYSLRYGCQTVRIATFSMTNNNDTEEANSVLNQKSVATFIPFGLDIYVQLSLLRSR